MQGEGNGLKAKGIPSQSRKDRKELFQGHSEAEGHIYNNVYIIYRVRVGRQNRERRLHVRHLSTCRGGPRGRPVGRQTESLHLIPTDYM